MNPPAEFEARKHKLKRLVQSPNSFFMDVKCQGCFNITTVFSHSQTVVLCGSCSAVLCQPTGGKARLTEGCSFRPKVQWVPSALTVCAHGVRLESGGRAGAGSEVVERRLPSRAGGSNGTSAKQSSSSH